MKNEAQKGQVTCSGSHSQETSAGRTAPWSPRPNSLALNLRAPPCMITECPAKPLSSTDSEDLPRVSSSGVMARNGYFFKAPLMILIISQVGGALCQTHFFFQFFHLIYSSQGRLAADSASMFYQCIADPSPGRGENHLGAMCVPSAPEGPEAMGLVSTLMGAPAECPNHSSTSLPSATCPVGISG